MCVKKNLSYNFIPKEKFLDACRIFEKVQPDFATDENLIAGWKGKPFLIKGKESSTKGHFKSDSIAKGSIS